MACNVVEYDWPTTPPGSEAVVMARFSATTRLKDADAICAGLPESVADTAKLKLPAVGGVPLMTPVEGLRLNPAGRVAEDQE